MCPCQWNHHPSSPRWGPFFRQVSQMGKPTFIRINVTWRRQGSQGERCAAEDQCPSHWTQGRTSRTVFWQVVQTSRHWMACGDWSGMSAFLNSKPRLMAYFSSLYKRLSTLNFKSWFMLLLVQPTESGFRVGRALVPKLWECLKTTLQG